MPEETENPNAFATGLDEWEHPLGKGAQGAVRTRGAVRTKRTIRARGATPIKPGARSDGDVFSKGLGAWEHPLGRRR